jgi:hypothetical protein
MDLTAETTAIIKPLHLDALTTPTVESTTDADGTMAPATTPTIRPLTPQTAPPTLAAMAPALTMLH